MAAMASSPATPAVLAGATLRVSATSNSSPFLVIPSLPPLPRRAALSVAALPETRRFSSLRVRASSSEESGSALQTDELLSDLKEKWDGLENKSTVLIYGGGAIVAVWLSSIIVGAINSVPLLPKIMELVGLGYTGWFVYRYLLFKSNRKELATDIEVLKKKIAGTSN